MPAILVLYVDPLVISRFVVILSHFRKALLGLLK